MLKETPIPDLIYYDDVISPEEEKLIVNWIDTKPWSNVLSRRTQHYGYLYDYKKKIPLYLPDDPITGPLLDISKNLSESSFLNPNQCIVNEYLQNQGIAPHIDSLNFGPVVVSLSLLSPTNMIFDYNDISHTLTLNPRSMVILKGQSRYQYRHSIPQRKTVTLSDGSTYNKPSDYRRISLTYREVPS